MMFKVPHIMPHGGMIEASSGSTQSLNIYVYCYESQSRKGPQESSSPYGHRSVQYLAHEDVAAMHCSSSIPIKKGQPLFSNTIEIGKLKMGRYVRKL